MAYYHGLSSSSSSSDDPMDDVEENGDAVIVDQQPVHGKWVPWQGYKANEGDKVIAVVTKVHHREVLLEVEELSDGTILEKNSRPLAVLQIQNMRKFEIDKIQVSRCYRLGDKIQGTVRGVESGGSKKMRVLETVDDCDGVIEAMSLDGGRLEPVSWCLMRCTKTGKFESRKVAKPSTI
eukprot:GHVH01004799.1.p1 GENE.GHVH01004799.1~~GHVH01004799.1.p1  ORF type:complete len:179 (-),score=37.40 GHVH01004799.1:124-660(-)